MPTVSNFIRQLPSYTWVQKGKHCLSLNPGRFGPGSFRPGLFRSNFGVGRFGLGRWVDSALGRFGRSLYQNIDCLGQADKQVNR